MASAGPVNVATHSTRLRQVPAARGILWVRQGFAVFGRKPLAFSGMLGTFLFGALVLVSMPLIGPLVLVAYLPLVTLGFMLATQLALHDRFPTPALFFSPLRQDRSRLRAHLKLGLTYALATVAIVSLSDSIDGGRFGELQEALAGGAAKSDEATALLNDPRLQWGLIVRFGLAAVLSIPFWHAPALVHWSGQSPAQSLFSSTLACWRNRGAFVMYALSWSALLMMVGLGTSLVFGLLGMPQLISLMAVPVALLFTTAFYASLFFTFADCFELVPPAAEVVDAPTPEELL